MRSSSPHRIRTTLALSLLFLLLFAAVVGSGTVMPVLAHGGDTDECDELGGAVLGGECRISALVTANTGGHGGAFDIAQPLRILATGHIDATGGITINVAGGIFLDAGGVIEANDPAAPTATGASPIVLNATGGLTMENGSAIEARNTGGDGASGTITIDVDGAITLNGSARIDTSNATGSGSGGAITIVTGGTLTLNSTAKIDSSDVLADGNGGIIDIDVGGTGSLILTGTARIDSADAAGGGDGGNIIIDVPGTLNLASGTMIRSTDLAGNGSGGSITITADDVIISGSILAEERGGTSSGNGGNISITYTGDFTLNGTGIVSSTKDTGSGGGGQHAGNITIAGTTTSAILLKSGSQILAESGDASAGNVVITPGGDFTMQGTATISTRKTTNAGDTGTAGDITIQVSGAVSIAADSVLNADGRGEAGNIVITAHTIQMDGTITSGFDSVTGTTVSHGGQITLDAECTLTVTGFISSKGRDFGADLVHLEGCDVVISASAYIESTGVGHANAARECDKSRYDGVTLANATACIEIYAGGTLQIDGELNADVAAFSPCGGGGNNGLGWIDIFATKSITIGGDVHANQNCGTNGTGGQVTVKSKTGSVTTTGTPLRANDTLNGGDGGKIVVEANTDVTFGASIIQALGADVGGNIAARAFNGILTGTASGTLDTRSGSATGGVTTLQGCGAGGPNDGVAYAGTRDAATNNTPADACGGSPTTPVLPVCNCGTTEETPNIVTELHNDSDHAVIPINTSVPLNSTVHDKATVTGGNGVPTGTVTFTFYRGGNCTTGTPDAVVLADTVTLVAGVAHPSPAKGPLGPGSYAFKATYNGEDPNYTIATSACEPFSIAQGTSSLVTTLHKPPHVAVDNGGSVPLGTVMHDLATVTVSGPAAPTGNVTFTFYTNGTCTGGGSPAGVVALDGSSPGTAESNNTAALAVGQYSFKATWAGDANYPTATGECEPFSVSQGTSELVTTLHLANHTIVANGSAVPIGTIMHDLATVSVSSGIAPTGNVSFTFYTGGQGDCASGSAGAPEVVALDGANPGTAETANTAALTIGNYAFKATWAGDPNYTGSTGTCEPFSVSQGTSELVTTLHKPVHVIVPNGSSVPLNTVMHDLATVTVTGPFAPTGNVTFTFYTGGQGDCLSGTAGAPEVVALDGANPGKAETAPTAPLTVGQYAFKASWPGDAKYTGSIGVCEPFSVVQGTSSLVTTLQKANNDPVQNGASVPLGTSMHDVATVTVSGGTPPTGSVSFILYTGGNGDCLSGVGSSPEVVALNGANPGVAVSTNTQALAAGKYAYQATWPGDANYPGATGDCEPFNVDKSTSGLVTTLHKPPHVDVANGGTVPIGTIMHDLATVTASGAFAPTGNVSFVLWTGGAGNCDSGSAGTPELVALNGSNPGTAESTPTAALAVGQYAYKATWAGDANYTGSSGDCEPFSVDKGTSGLVTTLHKSPHVVVPLNSAVDLGTIMHDLATVTVSGAIAPTGNVSFTLWTGGNGNCDSGTPGTPEAVALNGANPGQAESTPTAALTPGQYAFYATWAGDTNYTGSSGDCEPFTVSQGSSGLVTTLHKADHTVVANGGAVDLGTIMHDLATVTVSGPIAPTGNVSFVLWTGGTGNCDSGTPGTPQLVALNGSSPGEAESSNTVALAAGQYAFKATWAGDTNYTGSAGDCEPFSVSKAPLTVSTNVHNAAHGIITTTPLGSTVHDQATINGVIGNFPPPVIAFSFYTNLACTEPGSSIANTGADPSGGVRSADNGPLMAGDYAFKASVVENENYLGDNSDCEPFTVGQGTSGLVTTLHLQNHTIVTNGSSVPLGTLMHDLATVTVSGAFAPTGNVSFVLFTGGNGDCDSGAAGAAEIVALNGSSPGTAESTDTAALAAGQYAFRASWSGDANYTGATGACEPFSVSQSTSSLVTTLHSPPHVVVANGGTVPLGTIMHDLATVTVVGPFAPSGDVSFTLFTGGTGDCISGTAATPQAVALDGSSPGTAESSDTVALGAGQYAFQATWAGDANYTGSTGLCEPFSVLEGNPGIITELHLADETVIPVGGQAPASAGILPTVHDSATMTGSLNVPTGSVSFTFFTNGTCTGQGTAAGTVALVNGVAHPSTSQGPLPAGSYSFLGHYNGEDPNYLPFDATCEPFTVSTVTIVKNTTSGNGGFGFVLDGTSDFSPTITTTGTPGTGSTTMVVLSGTYTVAETVPLNWNLDNFSCTIGTQAGPTSWGFDVIAGAAVTCTFQDSPLTGSITIVKETNPDNLGGLFDFNGDLGDIDLGDGDSETFTGLAAGSYSVDESARANWDLISITCTGTSQANIDVDEGARTVTINLLVGANVTCRFTNEQNVTEDEPPPDEPPTTTTNQPPPPPPPPTTNQVLGTTSTQQPPALFSEVESVRSLPTVGSGGYADTQGSRLPVWAIGGLVTLLALTAGWMARRGWRA